MVDAVVGLLAAAVGAAVGWLLARAAHARQEGELRVRLEERSERGTQLEGALAAAEQREQRLQAEVAALRESLARLSAELAAEQRAAGEKLATLQNAEQQLRTTFQALSAEALRSNNRSFLDLARGVLGEVQKEAAHDLAARQQAIDQLVLPLRESLQRVDRQLEHVEKARLSAYAGLSEQVKSLAVTQQQLHSETANLVKALRAPAVRGRWGEIQLRRVVELAGMLDHCDFFEQQSAAGENGRVRPDMIVRLPGGRNLIVDAKVPLAAYLEALEVDDAARTVRLREHARQVRDHMLKLGSKSYQDQFEPTPDLVIMFLPGETFFSAALQHDPGLIELGAEKKVIPASPLTLIPLLRAVAFGWRQERLAANAQQISQLGRDLYQRVRTLAAHFEDLRRGLESSVGAYNRAVASLESRVLVAARRFKDLGAATQEDIPAAEPVETAARVLDAHGDEESPGAPATS